MSNFLRHSVPCFVCEEEVTTDDTIFMLGIEVPYFNLVMHRSCYHTLDENLLDIDSIEKYKQIFNNFNQKSKKMLK